MPADYRVRVATLADADVLVRHRIAMFTDMGVTLDARELDQAFRVWLGGVMPEGTYRAWLVDVPDGAAACGGGITIIPWPPGPRYAGDRLAFVYNVYTEPLHRRRVNKNLELHRPETNRQPEINHQPETNRRLEINRRLPMGRRQLNPRDSRNPRHRLRHRPALPE